jgi:hypothetical protein
MTNPHRGERGVALVTVLLLMAMIAALLSAHFLLTRFELSTARSSLDATRGFYAAEAGLNIRAEELRKIFLGYSVPAGTPPSPLPGDLPCTSGDQGSGDFACIDFAFSDNTVRSWVDDDTDDDGTPDGVTTIVVPPGEDFQGLTAHEHLYAAESVAFGPNGRPRALLEMHLKSRLVPLFQFAAFYDKDLEILPGPAMTLDGPVHTNGNLFLDAQDALTIDGQVTTAGRLLHGRKNDASCASGAVSVHDLSGPLALPACTGGLRDELTEDDVDGTSPPHLDWQGMIRVGATTVAVPPPEALDPVPGAMYWDLADLRILLDLTDAATPIKVYAPDGTVDTANSAALDATCPSAAWRTSGSFHNFREGMPIEMLEVDVQELMDCIEGGVPGLMGGRALDDATHGGLVWYFGVDDGVNAAAPNDLGVRLRGGGTLGPGSGAVDIHGLTVVTNQALYVLGDYNEDAGADWRPAALLADSLNVLSNGWSDANSAQPLSARVATATTIRAAFLAGTDTTGGPAGEGALDTGGYNGGLENYPRFHEDWSGVTLTYRGSFVSLDRPIRVDGPWSAQSYVPPVRDWGFETRFNDPALLPPLSPRFVYLKHELFLRDYDAY